MPTLDLTPLTRATIGFDRIFNMLDAATRLDQGAPSYPPYNIELTGEDAYRIVMAVAGFGETDLDVTVKDNSLVVTAKKESAEANEVKYLYHGIANRAFERRFDLADHIRVTGAHLKNGLLHIELVREVPEALKPRRITVETAAAPKRMAIGDKAA